MGARRLHWRAMFDALSERLGAALGDLRGSRNARRGGDLECDAGRSALALLEADRQPAGRPRLRRPRARGARSAREVLKSLTPAQQVVKIVNDELTDLLGSNTVGSALPSRAVILLAGLQGAGKTTAAGKLALHLRKEGRKPGLIAADLQRPAAVDQLEQLGKQIDVPVYRADTQDPVSGHARRARARPRGRHRRGPSSTPPAASRSTTRSWRSSRHVRDEAKPTNVVLVLDSMLGQEAVERGGSLSRSASISTA